MRNVNETRQTEIVFPLCAVNVISTLSNFERNSSVAEKGRQTRIKLSFVSYFFDSKTQLLLMTERGRGESECEVGELNYFRDTKVEDETL